MPYPAKRWTDRPGMRKWICDRSGTCEFTHDDREAVAEHEENAHQVNGLPRWDSVNPEDPSVRESDPPQTCPRCSYIGTYIDVLNHITREHGPAYWCMQAGCLFGTDDVDEIYEVDGDTYCWAHLHDHDEASEDEEEQEDDRITCTHERCDFESSDLDDFVDVDDQLYCPTHADRAMICEAFDCDYRSFAGESFTEIDGALYCVDHADADWFCEHPECTYVTNNADNLVQTDNGYYCEDHAPEDSEYPAGHEACDFYIETTNDYCKTPATFGYHCPTHTGEYRCELSTGCEVDGRLAYAEYKTGERLCATHRVTAMPPAAAPISMDAVTMDGDGSFRIEVEPMTDLERRMHEMVQESLYGDAVMQANEVHTHEQHTPIKEQS